MLIEGTTGKIRYSSRLAFVLLPTKERIDCDPAQKRTNTTLRVRERKCRRK